MTSVGPFQPRAFYDLMTLQKQPTCKAPIHNEELAFCFCP